MGNIPDYPQHKRPLGRLDKTDIKICCQQISTHLTLQIGKKADEFKFKETEIAKLLGNKYFDRTDLGFSCQSALKLLKYIKACKIVCKASKIIEDKAGVIEMIVAKNSFSELESLMPYIESIIWSTTFLNLQQIKPFNNMIYNYFGPTIFSEVKTFKKVDKELIDCKEEATAEEIKNYLEGVIARHNIITVTIKDILSGLQTSYNPFQDMSPNNNKMETTPPSNVGQKVTLNLSNDDQIKEIGTMLQGFQLDRKNTQRSTQAYLEVVKKLRTIGV